MISPLARKLLRWYRAERRDLPWRRAHDPYAIWVSEIMLQQTRVETVIPYYRRWMQSFPTTGTLAAATQREALSLWEGLGYYSRARNLHRAAQVVVEEHGGELPSDLKALRALPGIGRYTAGAIASLAFGMDEPAVDGNVKRLFSRLFNIQEPIDSTAGEKSIWALAGEHLPSGQSGDYNQALMELGARVCTPRSPDCPACPLKRECEVYHLGIQELRPLRTPKPESPHLTVTAAVIRRNGRVLIAQRPQDGLLGGLWEFPGGQVEDGESLKVSLKRELREELGVKVEIGEALGEYRHVYSHFRVTLHAFACRLVDGDPRPLEAAALKWVYPSTLSDYPMGNIDRRISQRLTKKTPRHEATKKIS